MENFNFLELLLNTVLASFGGLVRRLSEMENVSNDPRKNSLSYYIIGSFISMFVGIVIYFLCKNFEISQYLTAGLTSLGGYMGVPILELLSKIVTSKIQHTTNYSDKK